MALGGSGKGQQVHGQRRSNALGLLHGFAQAAATAGDKALCSTNVKRVCNNHKRVCGCYAR